jgi:hypothetical protein
MFSYSTGYYVSPPDDQYLKFKNRCSLVQSFTYFAFEITNKIPELSTLTKILFLILQYDNCVQAVKIIKFYRTNYTN